MEIYITLIKELEYMKIKNLHFYTETEQIFIILSNKNAKKVSYTAALMKWIH